MESTFFVASVPKNPVLKSSCHRSRLHSTVVAGTVRMLWSLQTGADVLPQDNARQVPSSQSNNMSLVWVVGFNLEDPSTTDRLVPRGDGGRRGKRVEALLLVASFSEAPSTAP